ncbi:YbaY family lipoprotein [Salidesulfovibrio brasiliensis]|uniref:YbaY family lipoprotein n=1 Tax=Salidesulfovibrio brasiliensis TaxID=221711 RepID=UPI0006CFE758|nr:YbaY family lipoprotein [Salidesulfovibrio brasiliensis]
MRKLFMLATVLLVLAGCTQAGKTPAPQASEDFTAREWRLERNGDHPVIDFSHTTIFFGRDGKVHGSGGCNSFSGPWSLTDGKLEIGPLATTLKICPAEALNRQESRFFQSLSEAQDAAIDPKTGALRIMVQGQQSPMIFHEVRRDATAQGSIFYRERIALSPQAVVTVLVQDVSRADAAAVTIGKQVIRNPGQVPIRFAVEYDPADIRPGHTYAVRAEIRDRGRLIFTTDTRHLLTDDPMEIMLVMVH